MSWLGAATSILGGEGADSGSPVSQTGSTGAKNLNFNAPNPNAGFFDARNEGGSLFSIPDTAAGGNAGAGMLLIAVAAVVVIAVMRRK